MRDYAKVGPKAWHGQTFKALRKKGPEALIVGLYLMTSPSSNMLGLYAQPVLYMAHETGLGQEGAMKGLQACIEVGFCSFDYEADVVWVHEMAKYQIAPELKATDLRCKGVQKDYEALPENKFLGPFYDRYAAVFHMTDRRPSGTTTEAPNQAPTQAPSKPRAGTGTGTGTGAGEGTGSSGADAPLPPASPAAPLPTGQVLTLTGSDSPASIPPCPIKQLVGLFAMKLPGLPQPRFELWKDSAGAEAMRQRWKWLLSADAVRDDDTRYAETAAQGVQWFDNFFNVVSESDFLTGRSGGWNNCDLAWLMKRENFMKVVQGNYENKKKAHA